MVDKHMGLCMRAEGVRVCVCVVGLPLLLVAGGRVGVLCVRGRLFVTNLLLFA